MASTGSGLSASSAAAPLPTRVAFDDHAQVDQFVLMEVSEDMLQRIQAGQTDISIRGQQQDDTVLVTQDKTYSVRLVESSNTVLVVSEPQPSRSDASAPATTSTNVVDRLVRGAVTHHYELAEIKPRTASLRTLLLTNPYDGSASFWTASRAFDPRTDSTESAAPGTRWLYSFAALREIVQASDAEMLVALRRLQALEWRGYWVVLHADYQAKVFDALLAELAASRCALDAIDAEACVRALRDMFEEEVIRHAVTVLCEEGKEVDGGARRHRLSARAVCVFKAMQLFAQREPYPDALFMGDLQDAVPYGVRVDEAYLRGIALRLPMSGAGGGAGGAGSLPSLPPSQLGDALGWHYFPAHALSTQPKQRLHQLFEVRAQWLLPDIEPYLTEVCEPGQTVDQLLLKHARAVTSVASKSAAASTSSSATVYMRR